MVTCSGAEPQPPQQVAGESVSVPHRELHAGLGQIGLADAVVHHGVVEHRLHGPPQDARLLTALPARVRQHEARSKGERQGAFTSHIRRGKPNLV